MSLYDEQEEMEAGSEPSGPFKSLASDPLWQRHLKKMAEAGNRGGSALLHNPEPRERSVGPGEDASPLSQSTGANGWDDQIKRAAAASAPSRGGTALLHDPEPRDADVDMQAAESPVGDPGADGWSQQIERATAASRPTGNIRTKALESLVSTPASGLGVRLGASGGPGNNKRIGIGSAGSDADPLVSGASGLGVEMGESGVQPKRTVLGSVSAGSGGDAGDVAPKPERRVAHIDTLARLGQAMAAAGTNFKPDYRMAEKTEAMSQNWATEPDRKAAMDRKTRLDNALIMLHEAQAKKAAAGRPEDPTAEAKAREADARAKYWERKAAAPIGGGRVAGSGHASGVGAGGGFTQDDADIAAKLYLSGNKFALGRDPTGEKAAMVLRSIGRIAKENGIDPARAIADARANMGTLNTLTKTNAVLEGQEGSIDAHFNILMDAASDPDLVKTASPAINKALNYGMSEVVGDPATTKLINAIETSASEYARYMTPSGQTTDAVRAKAEKMISAAMSEGTLRQVVDQMRAEIAAKKKAMGAARDDVAGRIKTVGSGESVAQGGKVKVRDPKSGRTASVSAADVEKALSDPESRIFGWEQIK